MSNSSDITEHAILGLVFGGLLLQRGLKVWATKRDIQNTPLSKIEAVAMGDAEIAGEVKPLALVKAKYSLKDCVYCAYLVENQNKNGWQKEAEGEQVTIFQINDGTGDILLDPIGLTYYGEPTYQVVAPNGLRYTEHAIFPSQIVFVKGAVSKVKRVVGGVEREEKIVGQRQTGEFVLSAYSEERLVSQFTWSAPLQIFGGMVVFLGSLWYLVGYSMLCPLFR